MRESHSTVPNIHVARNTKERTENIHQSGLGTTNFLKKTQCRRLLSLHAKEVIHLIPARGNANESRGQASQGRDM
jgi:hypothetical protein